VAFALGTSSHGTSPSKRFRASGSPEEAVPWGTNAVIQQAAGSFGPASDEPELVGPVMLRNVKRYDDGSSMGEVDPNDEDTRNELISFLFDIDMEGRDALTARFEKDYPPDAFDPGIYDGLVVAVKDGMIAGFMDYPKTGLHDPSQVAQINILVAKDHRGTGLARNLAKQVDEILIAKGYRYKFSRVWENNTSQVERKETRGWQLDPALTESGRMKAFWIALDPRFKEIPPPRLTRGHLHSEVPTVTQGQSDSPAVSAAYPAGASPSHVSQAGTPATVFQFEPGQTPADRVTIGDRQFVSAPLSAMRFARRLICPVGQQAQPFMISRLPDPETTRTVLADRGGNRALAHQRLADINALMLGRYPSTLELLRRQSAAAARHLRHTDPYGSALEDAIGHYRSYGDNVLMNAIACGHKTIPEFLHATMPGEYPTDEDVMQWCEEFLSRYGGDSLGYEPDDVMHRFENHDELQRETRVLDRFLRIGPPMANVCLIKGISDITTDQAATMSTQVVGRDYVQAFLSGQQIMYDGFLSTTFEPDNAVEFAGGNPATQPVYAVDFDDRSGRSEVLRRHALADLSSGADKDQTLSIMLAIRTRQARGAVIDSSASPGIAAEKEALLAPGHVLVPSMAIRCEKGYVLLADAYHRDFVH
jgi:GNAT superfamily N-acetyltransferase